MSTAVMVNPLGLPRTPQPFGQAQASRLSPELRKALSRPGGLDNALRSQLHSQSQSQSLPRQPDPDHSSPFLALPTEIHVALAQFLPFREQWALKRTNRYFHSINELAAPVSFFRQRRRGRAYQQDLLAALSSAAIVRRGYEPCHACERFRWKGEFEVAQFQRGFLWCVAPASATTGGAEALPAVWNVAGGEAGEVLENGKFCMDCGIAAEKYRAGETVEVVHDWSDSHDDRKSVVVGAVVQGGRRTGVMVSEQGQEDLERKFNEVCVDYPLS